jgi:arylsulfatase A-like enzyme
MDNNRPKNIFLITIDCLRADFVGCISGTNFTPCMDRLSKQSTVFSRAFANGPGTNQSFPAILTSTYFLMHGGMRLLPHFSTLAEVARDNGFKTAAFHSNPFLSESLGWGRGFTEFHDFMDVIKSPSAFIARQQNESLPGKLAWFASNVLMANRSTKIQRLLKKIYYKFSHLDIPYLDGKELNCHAMKWIERNRDESFFLWMHYMDPHYPYIPPEQYLSDFSNRQEAFAFNLSIDYKNPSEDDVRVSKRLYLGEVRYVDACVGELIRCLEDNGLLEKSLLLLVADHGHAFMEHGKFGHAYDILYNEVLHVPLILRGLESSKRVDVPVQLLDIPPTITDVLNIKKPRSFMGQSLMHFIEGGKQTTPLISESAYPDLIKLRYDTNKRVVSCTSGRWKLIVNEILDSVELYDVEKDFEERIDVAAKQKKKVRELERIIEKHFINIMRAPFGSTTSEDLDCI